MADYKKALNDLQELCEYLFHEYKVCYKGDEEDTYNRFLAANNALNLLQEEQKFFVDSDGRITPLPIQPQWISVKDRMPAETHSMFFKLYGTPKWRDAMWKEESDNVLVAISFEDGSQSVISGYTQDGKWHTGISKMLPYTVTHWMPLPEPPEVIRDGIQ